MKRLSFKRRNDARHWVGDGFPVRSVFSYDELAEPLSPFLLLDHAGPATFDATSQRRGVGRHPHRGFETVTIVYEGEVEHRDSAGGGGSIGPGDVQWMTAGAGIIHEEYHGTAYAQRGGPFEMVQLWVNLPARDKMTAPRYQGITSAQIPSVELPDGAGAVRVIAGSFGGQAGPARTFSPIELWDVRLKAGRRAEFRVPAGHTTALFVLHGTARVAGDSVVEGELAVLEREGDAFAVEAAEALTLLVLAGAPLNEPVVGYGPFVMNSQEEIAQAFADFRAGRLGNVAAPTPAPVAAPARAPAPAPAAEAAEWKTLAGALRSLHAVLLQRARAEYVQERGIPASDVGPGELLMLATRDEGFAWLRSLSELMTELDELRDSPGARQDASLRAAVRETIEQLLAPPGEGADRTAFQEAYWRHVQADPEVTMAHAGLRQALAAWPRGGDGRSTMASHLEALRKRPSP